MISATGSLKMSQSTTPLAKNLCSYKQSCLYLSSLIPFVPNAFLA